MKTGLAFLVLVTVCINQITAFSVRSKRFIDSGFDNNGNIQHQSASTFLNPPIPPYAAIFQVDVNQRNPKSDEKSGETNTDFAAEVPPEEVSFAAKPAETPEPDFEDKVSSQEDASSSEESTKPPKKSAASFQKRGRYGSKFPSLKPTLNVIRPSKSPQTIFYYPSSQSFPISTFPGDIWSLLINRPAAANTNKPAAANTNNQAGPSYNVGAVDCPENETHHASLDTNHTEIHKLPKHPQTPERPERPQTPERPERPQTPERPERPETPERPERPEATKAPEHPEATEAPEHPEATEAPEHPEATETPEHPEANETPDHPEATEIQDHPQVPEISDTLAELLHIQDHSDTPRNIHDKLRYISRRQA